MVKNGRSPVFLGLLAAACAAKSSSVMAPLPSSGGADVAGSKTAVFQPADRKEPATGKALDLRQFTPLLAMPVYSKVRQAADDGEFSQALTEAMALEEPGPLSNLDRARRSYLRGLLASEAGLFGSAEAAFLEASQEESWVLKNDALLHLAEARLERDPKEALSALDSVTGSWHEGEVARLRAQGFTLLGRHLEAARAWAQVIRSRPDKHARIERAKILLLAAKSAASAGEKKSLAGDAALEIAKVRVGLSTEDPLYETARGLQQEAEKYGAQPPKAPELEEQLAHLRGLSESFKWEELHDAALEVKVPSGPENQHARCELDYLKAKALSGEREWGAAADRLRGATTDCTADAELHSWILFNAGKYSAADGRHTQAVAYYDQLERLYPKSFLADDSRLRAAKSYLDVGVTARFVSLLSDMPDLYPDGDMTMEGVLLLALHQMEQDDWSAAAAVLQRAAQVIRKEDSARGHEYAGTERYFLARSLEQLGREEAAYAEYESIISEVPLSYYMLHAYSRLLEIDSARAQKALSVGLQRAQTSPFEFPHRPEYDTLVFRRGMEMLRVGETMRAQRLLSELGLGPEADDSLMWGIALLYDRAGEVHESHGIARGRLTDWLSHYPEGDWRSPWEIGFPRPYHAQVQRESRATDVPEWFIYGVMREESTFQADVVSHADAYGLMQIIPPTARAIGKKAGLPYSREALKRPSVNIAIGSRVLAELSRRFKTNPWLAIPGYNAGPGRPARWLRERPNVDFDIWVEMIPFRETRRYTKRVLASRAAYAFLYYRDNAQTALVLPKRLNSQ